MMAAGDGRDEANVVVRCRRQIEDMFRRYAPERLETLDNLMKKYKVRANTHHPIPVPALTVSA